MTNTPGAILARHFDTPGTIGVLPDGLCAMFNGNGKCSTCCLEIAWSFTDQGFIVGGQGGAARSYSDPASVPASPWTLSNGGLTLRIDFEDDFNCRMFNPNTQTATATASVSVPFDMILLADWSGVGEREQTNFELMSFSVDGSVIGSAHTPGGGLGCAPMGPVVSSPQPPVQIPLTAGPHTFDISVTTANARYHFGAFYLFVLSFQAV